jgi:hypothetical protein
MWLKDLMRSMTNLPSFSGSLSKKDWEHLSDVELDALAVEIFDFYRERGFPFYVLTDDQRELEFTKLHSFFALNSGRLIDSSGRVGMSMHGLALAWSFFPHAWDVRVGKMKTPFEVFYDDDVFLAAIKKRFRRGTYFSDSGIRKALRTHSGAQGVSNFRPTAAAAIYARYLHGKDNVVWDMSGGFGGRMLGAAVSEKVAHYICTDPSTPTFNGLCDLSVDINSWTSHIRFSVKKFGSEFFVPERESLDFCFTSPPYFDTEKYTEESSQSYLQHPSVELWNEGFLRKTIQNCFIGLKSGRFMALNVANVKSHPSLEADTVRIAKEEGFVFEETLRLSLSNVFRGGYKYEPVFVFRKL